MSQSHLGRCLAVVDACLCLLLFFPLSVFHWRGTWELQDIYILPERYLDSSWISFGIGANFCTIMLLLQPSLAAFLKPFSRPTYLIVSRVFIYVHGWAVMCYWRGLWNLMDYYLTENWLNSTVMYAIAQLFAYASTTVRTNVGVPVAIALDTDPDLLAPDTMWKTEPQHTWKFIGDVLFTQFVIVTSNIAMWRGMWNILDAFLFPGDVLLSDLVSLVVGFGVIACLFALQLPCGYISERLDAHKGWKICYENVLFLVLCWANLMLWRGGWDLCVHYMLPHSLLGPWLCHWIGTLGLMAFQVFNNVGLNGIERDGQYPRGEGIYPTKYLQVFMADFVQKKTIGQKYLVVDTDEETTTDSADSDFSESSLKTLIERPLTVEAEGIELTNITENHNINSHSNGQSNGHYPNGIS
ncbi:hypothetical protein CAPTEDRAFT_177777 [Capitella teleta]|uniref:Uncharacterized protein n=1 Tax=Capitella teleta TaxID=283909 RepID=R7TY02_CAPTE|nr:hypothetical protein CAPTEDRAFT_177777 [Capitella teleta]|eukprot:ELT95825.1 hypothetical protein CAPTEDRAFT_177777 [Capitella teleta]